MVRSTRATTIAALITGIVEQHLRVGDRIQRWHVDDHHAPVGGELGDQVGDALRSEQLRWIVRKSAGGQDAQIREIREWIDEQRLELAEPVIAVVTPRPAPRSKGPTVPGRRRSSSTSTVRRPLEGDHVGQVHSDRGLALADTALVTISVSS